MTNQLGGWSVSWQGVFGVEPAVLRRPARPDPAGDHRAQGHPAGRLAVHAGDLRARPGLGGQRAPDADAAVVVVGEKAYAEVLGDRPLPRLDADQQALIAALEATGKPVIVVVIAGRPLGLGAGEQANALLMAWQGGTETRRGRRRRAVRQGTTRAAGCR